MSTASRVLALATEVGVQFKALRLAVRAQSGISTNQGPGSIPPWQINWTTRRYELGPGFLYQDEPSGTTYLFRGFYGQDAQAQANWGRALARVSSVAGRFGDVVLTKSDVGLGNVDNTSDADKPVSTAQATADEGIRSLIRGTGSLSNLLTTAKDNLVSAINEVYARSAPPPAIGARGPASNQTIPSGAWTVVTLSSTSHNTGGKFTLTSSWIEVPDEGIYTLSAYYRISSGNGNRVMHIETWTGSTAPAPNFGATLLRAEVAASGTSVTVNANTDTPLPAGSKVRLLTFIQGGGQIEAGAPAQLNIRRVDI